MKLTAEQIAALAQQLAAIAATFNPAAASTIGPLFGIGSQFVAMLQKLREDTEGLDPALWKEISEKYGLQVDGFRAAVAKSREVDAGKSEG